MMPLDGWCEAAVLGASAVGAITDTRHGTIPNRLTLPALAAGMAVHTALHGWRGLLFASAGLLLCAAVPALLFAKQAMGGGDLKLLAAIGAWLGPHRGLEVQLVACLLAAMGALLLLAWRRQLSAMLRSAASLAMQTWLPRSKRRPAAAHSLHTLRFGLAIFAAACIASVWRHVQGL